MSPEYNVSKEKQRLQNLMSYGSEVEPIYLHKVKSLASEKLSEEKDRFEEGILYYKK